MNIDTTENSTQSLKFISILNAYGYQLIVNTPNNGYSARCSDSVIQISNLENRRCSLLFRYC